MITLKCEFAVVGDDVPLTVVRSALALGEPVFGFKIEIQKPAIIQGAIDLHPEGGSQVGDIVIARRTIAELCPFAVAFCLKGQAGMLDMCLKGAGCLHHHHGLG